MTTSATNNDPHARVAAQMKTLQQLEAEIADLERAGVSTSASMTDEEAAEARRLQEENAKLRYQLTHLERNIKLAQDTAAAAGASTASGASGTTASTSPVPSTYVMTTVPGKAVNIQAMLSEYFAVSMHTLEGFEPKDIIITVGRQADYQCNSAMALGKKMKKKPRDVAELIVKNLPKCEYVDRVDIAGPGFINIWMNAAWVGQLITRVLTAGAEPPQMEREGLTAVVDFSSPNIAKQMHVGHLRSTIIGDSICRLLEFCGVHVHRTNHVGDWGTQFGMLIAHLADRFPDYKTVSPPIGDLQAFYKESKIRFDADETFKATAYDKVVKLQTGDPDVRFAWTLICEVSRKEFSKIYERLDIRIEERGESFYQPLMGAIVEELNQKKFLVEEDGRKLFFTDFDKVPLTVVKSDGGYTYATSDLTALKYRLDVQKADWVIYVVDSGQGLHLKSVYAGGRMAGWFTEDSKRVEHVGFGVVLGDDHKKFKTRSGDTVRLVDLLDEAVVKATSVLVERERDQVLSKDEMQRAVTAIAYGSVKYADLCKNRASDYVFSFDSMLSFSGNTAVYILFAYMRCVSIVRKSGVDLTSHVGSTTIVLVHAKERQLALMLLRFTEVVELLLKTMELHHMCDYLYKLSGVFTEFYDACRVIDANKNTNISRLLLCDAAAIITRKGLDLLGIPVLEKL